MLAGHHLMLAGVVIAIAVWCAFGIAMGLPQEWFLLSNAVGTITTLFLLLLMQHSQNRDTQALQAKVDELIRSSDAAGNHWIGVEQHEVHVLEAMIGDRRADG